MEILASKTLCAVTVYIDGLPHLHLKLEGFRAMYSYLVGFGSDRRWWIEFHYVGMAAVEVEYNSVEKWTAVLKALEPLLK